MSRTRRRSVAQTHESPPNQQQDEPASGSPGRRALGAVLLGVVGVGFGCWWWASGWRGAGSGDLGRLGQVTIGAEPWLQDPAFLPDATVEDFKQEAFATAQDLVQAFPDKAAAIGVAARLEFAFGQIEEAVTLWKKCVALNPQDGPAYYGLGVAAHDNGDFEAAVRLFRETVALIPDEPRAPFMLGNCLMKSGKVDEAIATLEAHAQRYDLTVDSLELLGLGYLQNGNFEMAKRAFGAIILAAPTDRMGYYGMARVFLKEGDRQRADEYLAKFQSLTEDDVERWYKILPGTFDSRKLRGMETDTMRLRAVLVFTLNDAARACAYLNDSVRAEMLWRKAAVLEPKDGESRHGLMALFDRQRRYADAMFVCQELCTAEPDNAGHWFNAGLLYARADLVEESRAAIARAFELEPQNPQYRQAYELSRGAH